ncbi:hypothetical protein BH23GEM4_BH23GEM4_23130 [soil metagenome]
MNPTLLVCLCFSLGTGPKLPEDRPLGEDKWKHFVTSFVATSLVSFGARTAGISDDGSLITGVAVGAALGIGKELRDARTSGETASFGDLLFDAGGVAAAAVVFAQGS